MGKWSKINELCCKTARFGPLIALGNVVLKFGKRFLSADKLQDISTRRNIAIQARLKPLVTKVVKEFKNEPLIKTGTTDTQTIWVCWLQGENSMSEIPKLCLESIRKKSCGRRVEVITLSNFQRFVEISPVVIEKYNRGLIKNCHFADILRVSLLAQKGGLWMDATMYCARTIDDHFLSDTFYSVRIKEFGNFVSRCRWAVYCLRATPGTRLFRMIERLFEEYVGSEDYFIDYFLFDQFIDMIYNQDPDIKEMIDNVEENNPDIFSLLRKLPQKFNVSEWNSLVDSTSLFKLSWKEYSSAQLGQMDNSDTYYSFIKNNVR